MVHTSFDATVPQLGQSYRLVLGAFIAACDGLKGLPDAIASVWPQAIVPTCILHLVRKPLGLPSPRLGDLIAKALRPVGRAATEPARQAFEELAETWDENTA